MKILVLGAAVLISPAAAQVLPYAGNPFAITVPFNDVNGLPGGTATKVGNIIVLRNSKGEIVATVVLDQDGAKTLYDPQGKILDRLVAPEK
jgi:LDH2 family malate/lactate/ureidoglycolate dehydrogenase